MKALKPHGTRSAPKRPRRAGMIRIFAIGLALTCLPGLSGCSLIGAERELVPVTIRLKPPAALLSDTPEPVLGEGTNSGLLDYALDLRSALRKANADKKALREWADTGLKNH